MEPPRPPDAFKALYEEHFPRVRGLARRMGVRDADVPDVAQEAFGALARRMREGLDTSAPVWPYLRAIVVTRALNWKKLARNREQPHADAEAVEAMTDARAAEGSMESSISVRACVDAVLQRLPRDQRDVLVLADVEEVSIDEAAHLLGITTAATYSRLYRAREAFAREWGERRSTDLAAFAPFALWDARSLLANDRAVPPAPRELQDEVWRRLAASGAAMAAAGAAAGAAAVKAGFLLTAKQLAAGALISALAGAGMYAALSAARESKEATTAVVAVQREEPARVGVEASASASASAALPPAPVIGTAAAAVTAEASAVAVPPSAANIEANERHLLDGAREAISRGDWAGARAALARVRSARNAAERDVLLGIVRSYAQDGGGR